MQKVYIVSIYTHTRDMRQLYIDFIIQDRAELDQFIKICVDNNKKIKIDVFECDEVKNV